LRSQEVCVFRSDLDAALARAEAAERQLAELRRQGGEDRQKASELERALADARAEIEKLRKLAKRDQPAPRSAPRGGGESSSSGWTWAKRLAALGAVLAVGGTVAGAILGQRACERRKALRSPGELYAAHVMRAQGGQERLIVVSEAIQLEHGESDVTPWRIDLVDPSSGQRLVRKVFWDKPRKQRPELAPAGPGRFWCDLDGSFVGQRNLIELCDVDTLQVAVSTQALVAKNPSLAAGFSYSPTIDLGSGALTATTQTGETIVIDAQELVVRPFRASHDLVCLESYAGGGRVLRATLEAAAGDLRASLGFHEGGNCASLDNRAYRDRELRAFLRGVPRQGGLGQSQRGSTPSLSAAGDFAFQAIDGGQRQGLFREPVGGGGGVRVGDKSFLAPELLAEYGPEHQGIVLPGGPTVILIHRDTLDSHTAQLLISRLDLEDGNLSWTLTLPAGEVLMGHLAGEVAIVAVRQFSEKAGSERWRYSP